MALDIERIFQPDGFDMFLERALGIDALLLEGDPSRFSGVVSWGTLNRLMAFGGLSSPRLRFVQGDDDLDENLYLRRDRRGCPRPLVGEINCLLRAGALLSIDGMELLHEPVADLCEAIEAAVRVPVGAELYACWGEGATRTPAWDDHETLLLQVEGRKWWQLFEPTGNYPVGGAALPPPTGDPRWGGPLGAGSILYIPRGWWYEDKAFAEPSLYLALTFTNARAADMLARLLGKSHERDLMRKDIPRFQSEETRSAFLTLAQNEFVSLVNEPGLLCDLLREIQESSDPRAEFNFPWSADLNPMPPGDDCRLTPLLRFPAAFSMGSRVPAEHMMILHNGAALTLDWETGSVLELICDPRCATLRSLLDICGDEMHSDRVLEHVFELVRLGLVAACPAAGEAGDEASPSDCKRLTPERSLA